MRGRWSATVVVAVVMVAASGCGSDAEDPTTTVATGESAASSAPTEAFQVMFDGASCVVEGPGEVPAGSYDFVLTDDSGMEGADVRTMHLADGHTYADLEALQAQPGDYLKKPDWTEWSLNAFGQVDAVLADNQFGKVIVLDPGTHAIVVGTGRPSGTWLCAPVEVTST